MDNVVRCFLNILQRYGNIVNQSIIYLSANIDGLKLLADIVCRDL